MDTTGQGNTVKHPDGILVSKKQSHEDSKALTKTLFVKL